MHGVVKGNDLRLGTRVGNARLGLAQSRNGCESVWSNNGDETSAGGFRSNDVPSEIGIRVHDQMAELEGITDKGP